MKTSTSRFQHKNTPVRRGQREYGKGDCLFPSKCENPEKKGIKSAFVQELSRDEEGSIEPIRLAIAIFAMMMAKEVALRGVRV